MSKRLRESVLASKKGRLLRAKAEQRRTTMTPAPGSVAPSREGVSPSAQDVDFALDALQEVASAKKEPRVDTLRPAPRDPRDVRAGSEMAPAIAAPPALPV